MNSQQLLNLLLQRHSDDVCVAECKDGPTWGRSHNRLDLWTLKRSWSPVTMTGYEIKASRSDFLGDDKWPGYLPLCHNFYFVCPYGLIEQNEVGSEAGLLWAAKTGTRLYTRKKAPRREIELPAALLVYVLMARVVIRGELSGDMSKEYWHKWLAEKKDNKVLGARVRGKIQEIAEALRQENAEIKREIKKYEDIQQRLVELGLDPTKSIYPHMITDRVKRLTEIFPPDLIRSAQKTKREIEKLLQLAEKEVPG